MTSPSSPSSPSSPLFRRILIANRGEIAIRIARAAAELGIPTVAVAPRDDARSLHTRRADQAVELPGVGAAAYLDGAAVIRAALETGADAIHPGYGFLAENAGFARACAEAGLTFIGPKPEALDLFGDKGAARRLAAETGAPLARGTAHATSLDEARSFFDSLGAGGAIMIKAVAGGGGRGMRVVRAASELAEAWTRAGAEALGAFGSDALYVEELIQPARHLEIQVLGDRDGRVIHLHERECSLQRRHQKLVEIAPLPGLDPALKARIAETAVALARAGGIHTLCTFEFLIDGRDPAGQRFVFMEANPRLQVEHTVTEEVTGVDLVQTQIGLAAGLSLAELGLRDGRLPEPEGVAVQLRINMEKIGADAVAVPAGGVISAFEVPGGRGVRVETFGYAGYATSPHYDSLLAKLIVHVPGNRLDLALDRARRALAEFRIEGVATNIGFLQSLIADEAVRAGRFDTGYIGAHAARLAEAADSHPKLWVESSGGGAMKAASGPVAPDGTEAVAAPMTGRVVAIEVTPGDVVRPGTVVAVIEAMKMEHTITAGRAGIVRALAVAVDETVYGDQPVLFIEPGDFEGAAEEETVEVDLDHIRPDLAAILELHDELTDARRPDAVARRRKTGQRTARENIEDLADPGSFMEYGALALAAQRSRHDYETLKKMSPADGLVAGVGSVNAGLFGAERARCMLLSYDYTVLAGTQGFMNHKKMDRMFHLANDWAMPLVVFAEGGGGRPGDTDHVGVAGLDVPTFKLLAQMSGKAPTVAVVSGRCFAGNAAIAGVCDVIIATRNANLGMGGPAMIEGGGLGVYKPEEVGPMDVQVPNGVVDILVEDEAEAVAAAKKYLSYFQGPVADWAAADQRLLRNAIPENRLRAYDVRKVIELVADTDSVLELRPDYGIGIITALIRIEGRPMGLFANNPRHLGGAIDGEAAEKAARFLDLCEAHGLPVLSLCDTPGFMVGPDAEKTALVRRVSRMFVGGANMTVPMFTIVLRKGYGLGAQAMAGGNMHAPAFTVSWPTGEFGGMGLEGAVRLGYRRDLEAIADPAGRDALYRKLVDALYAKGKASNMAAFLEIDGVIDPAASRDWVRRGLDGFPVPPAPAAGGKRRPFIATR
ncbi:acetyl-CoA carboxylase family protein [Tistrella mobilis]|uniref:Pyruvate carboxylase n=1 Tax=Tistrella mobilis (strain KA081020-065) TaxID=1110502 RepID=I3TTV7_TISMK|nr:carboxyl transferase domain-containing protein [Tistrella mobilis]AFK56195.1 pyruvate carboxylase [Tistrella mobilis KA081020-065]